MFDAEGKFLNARRELNHIFHRKLASPKFADRVLHRLPTRHGFRRRLASLNMYRLPSPQSFRHEVGEVVPKIIDSGWFQICEGRQCLSVSEYRVRRYHIASLLDTMIYSMTIVAVFHFECSYYYRCWEAIERDVRNEANAGGIRADFDCRGRRRTVENEARDYI